MELHHDFACHLSRNGLLIRVCIKHIQQRLLVPFKECMLQERIEKTHTEIAMSCSSKVAALRITTRWRSICYAFPLFKKVSYSLLVPQNRGFHFSLFATHCPLIQRLRPVLQLESLVPLSCYQSAGRRVMNKYLKDRM